MAAYTKDGMGGGGVPNLWTAGECVGAGAKLGGGVAAGGPNAEGLAAAGGAKPARRAGISIIILAAGTTGGRASRATPPDMPGHARTSPAPVHA